MSQFDEKQEQAALRGRARQLCDAALAAGAEEAEVYAVRSEGVAVTFEKGDLKLTQVEDGSTVGLRVLRERRQGFCASNQTGDGALEQTAEDAVTLAKLSPPDPHNELVGGDAPSTGESLVNAELAATPIETVVTLAREMVSAATQVDARVALDQASVQLDRSTHAIATSRGIEAAESDAQLSFSLFGMAVDGDDVGGFDYTGDALRDPAAVRPRIQALAAHFAEAVLGNLAAGAAKTYRGPVLFAPDAFFDLFLGPLVSASSAIAVQRGRSALAGKLGEEITTPALSLHDDPQRRDLAGARSFDREGVSVGRFPIVEKGVLQGWLYNGYAAQVDGCASTGHSAGGARAVPDLGPHALVQAPGDGGDCDAMLAALGTGLYVQRFSGTVDPASGDFSGVAKSARWVEPGEGGGVTQRPVRETLLSGNAFELLRSVLRISTQQERLFGSAIGSWALVDGVSVTAG